MRDDAESSGIQLGKVQAPALRAETLERPRLLDWLRAKIHGRVVLLIADAGYGKTTLLADLSRRIRLRTLWYRLDETDRDWTSFLRHLVGAGREHDPAFAPSTAALLTEIGVGGPSREIVLDTFIRELGTIATEGAIIVFDDFHLVDDAVDVRFIARELVQRAPERLTFVFASRRQPTIPLSKLRAVGEVAELGTDDLRFDEAETAQLFTETYGRQVDPDVLIDLARRTEGWIASLQLVQAALRNRTPTEIRRFILTLNGADHEMYDYLAEEVVGDLDLELQQFLMHTSLLQVVTPDRAKAVTELPPGSVATLTAAAERLTLLSRVSGGPRTHLRYHPLVRSFLEARLRNVGGPEAVLEAHLRTARAAAATDWQVAAYHYREADDSNAVVGVIDNAIPTIMGDGQYELADEYLTATAGPLDPPALHLVRSRVAMQRRDYETALAASKAVLEGNAGKVHRNHARLNLMTLYWNQGDREQALEMAGILAASSEDEYLQNIALVAVDLMRSADEGDLRALAARLRALADKQRNSHRHHYGVTMLNLASISLLRDEPEQALEDSNRALAALDSTSSQMERATAASNRVAALVVLGRWAEFEDFRDRLDREHRLHTEVDVQIERTDLVSGLYEPQEFDSVVRTTSPSRLTPAFRGLLAAAATRSSLRQGRYEDASRWLALHPGEPGTIVGAKAEHIFTTAYLATATGSPDAKKLLTECLRVAGAQGAGRWLGLTEILLAATEGIGVLSREVLRKSQTSPWLLTYLADVLVPRLSEMGDEAFDAIRLTADRYPRRWRVDLRRAIDGGGGNGRAGVLLEHVGERQDVARLRTLSKQKRVGKGFAHLGRTLSRRLADRVLVEDLGRLSIWVGPRHTPGSEVRRKVLALLTFLLTRPDMSATRDQVLDALWPDLDPGVAVNSLNQTLYFLRRVFEEDYSEDLSPGYVSHNSEIVWLDTELVSSRSIACRNLLRQLAHPASPDEVTELVRLYSGRFALDFEYEEWATTYRDALHASYLEVVERAVRGDIASGHLDRGIANARRALEVDPEAEEIEVSLLRLYRTAGAHAAAAEQYEHYASRVREELGVEPPTLDALIG